LFDQPTKRVTELCAQPLSFFEGVLRQQPIVNLEREPRVSDFVVGGSREQASKIVYGVITHPNELERRVGLRDASIHQIGARKIEQRSGN